MMRERTCLLVAHDAPNVKRSTLKTKLKDCAHCNENCGEDIDGLEEDFPEMYLEEDTD